MVNLFFNIDYFFTVADVATISPNPLNLYQPILQSSNNQPRARFGFEFLEQRFEVVIDGVWAKDL